MGTTSASYGTEQAAVRRVTASKTFTRNPRLIILLEYLCKKSFDGSQGSIKEYDIATDIFHRPPEFDQTTDAIVRVEMHRLRKKLKEYYAGEGADEEIEISLQAGKYLPEFIDRKKSDRGITTSSESQPSHITTEDSLPVRSRNHRTAIESWSVGLILLLLLTVGGTLLWNQRTRKAAPAIAPTPSRNNFVPAALPTGQAIRILCGSSVTGAKDREGNPWGIDRFYSGGTSVSPVSQNIYRTRDSMIFRAARTGEFSYRIPLRPGVYELHLYFSDTAFHPGADMDGGESTRTFLVELNGAPLLRDFDIISEAGPNTADIKVFKDVQPASDGYLHLAFFRQLGEPILNGIEILPGILHQLRPIRIVTQDRTFTDRAGLNWQPDNYFLNGRNISRFGTVSGPDDPRIYERERYGNFSYAIPVTSGHYTVTLHFAESFWGPDQVGGGGVGSRVFDVYCNGVSLLRSFDMFKEAGSQHQIVKRFRGLKPNAQGNLLLSFVPIKNYANLSAIEVVDESKWESYR